MFRHRVRSAHHHQWQNLNSAGYPPRNQAHHFQRRDLEFEVIPIMQPVQPYQQIVPTQFVHQDQVHIPPAQTNPFNICPTHFCTPPQHAHVHQVQQHHHQWPSSTAIDTPHFQQFHRVPIPNRHVMQPPPPIPHFAPIRNRREEENQPPAPPPPPPPPQYPQTFFHPQYFVQHVPIRRRATFTPGAPAYHTYLLNLIGTLIAGNSGYSSNDYLEDRENLDNYEALLSLAERLGEAKPRGLQKSDIDRITTCKFEECVDEEDQCSCVVCMSDFERGQILRVLPCRHRFHMKCVDKWLKLNRTCPICRADSSEGLNQC